MALTPSNSSLVHDAVLDYDVESPSASSKVIDWFASFFDGVTDEDGDQIYALPA